MGRALCSPNVSMTLKGERHMLNKKTVDDLKDLKGKKVLVRCDFNVPLKEGVIQNYNRIDGAIPTIKSFLTRALRLSCAPI